MQPSYSANFDGKKLFYVSLCCGRWLLQYIILSWNTGGSKIKNIEFHPCPATCGLTKGNLNPPVSSAWEVSTAGHCARVHDSTVRDPEADFPLLFSQLFDSGDEHGDNEEDVNLDLLVTRMMKTPLAQMLLPGSCLLGSWSSSRAPEIDLHKVCKQAVTRLAIDRHTSTNDVWREGRDTVCSSIWTNTIFVIQWNLNEFEMKQSWWGWNFDFQLYSRD